MHKIQDHKHNLPIHSSLLKFLITTMLSMFLLIGFAVPASAHVTAQDGAIEAILHIDPGDSPIVNQLAVLHFDFVSSKEKLTLAKCHCVLSISSQGQELLKKDFTDPDFTLGSTSLAFVYTFPSKAIYTIIALGTSVNNPSHTFKLSYDIRVDRENNVQTVGTVTSWIDHIDHHLGHIGFFVIAFGIGSILTYRNRKQIAYEMEHKL